MSKENPLDKKFNLIDVTPTKKEEVKSVSTEVVTVTDNAVRDFTTARASMMSIIDVGSSAVLSLGDIANQSQAIDAYHALAVLIKNVSDSASNLLKLHKQLEEISSKDKNKSNDTTIHNHLHLSTQELSERLKNNS